MKKWSILLGLLIALCWACSDDATETDVTDPFLLVTGLQIPKQQLAGTEITIYGKGFDKECRIRLQLNGGDLYDTEIISVDDRSVVFKAASAGTGFYVVILYQQEKSCRIGGINLITVDLQPEDVEGYGVMGEESSKICPISVSKKLKGDPLFSIPNDYIFYGGMMSEDSVLYYSYYYIDYIGSNLVSLFTLAAYDFRDNTNTLLQENVPGMLAFGQIGESLYMLARSEDESAYRLMKWKGGTSFEEEGRFINPAGNLVIINEGLFFYDSEARSLVMAGRDLAGDTRRFVWAWDLNSHEVREIADKSDMNFRLADCDGTIYVFGEKVTDSNAGTGNTYVLKPGNPAQWIFAELTPEASWNTGYFMAPIYDPHKKVVYGIDNNKTVMTYDIVTKAIVGSKWVNSGLVNVFLFK